MCLLFPLFTGFDGYRHITEAKLFLFAGLTLPWLISLIFNKERKKLPLPGLLLSAFLGWHLLSAILSPYGSAVWLGAGRYDGFLLTALYVLCCLGVASCGEDNRLYLRLFAVSVTLCCVICLLQLEGRNPLNLYPNGWNWYGRNLLYSGAFLGTVGNTVLLASVLCLFIPAALRKGGDGKDRLPLALAALLALYILYRSENSAGPLALAAGLFVLLPCCVKGRTRTYVLLAEGVLAAAALIIIYRWGRTIGTIYELSRVIHGEVSDSFGSSRVRIWRAVLPLLKERPLLGGGPGSLPLRIDVEFSRFVPETGETLVTFADNAHNEYLQLAADTGLVGLCLYLGAMGTTFFRGIRKPGGPSPWLCAITVYWIQAFFGLGLCLNAPMMFLLWGLELSS